MKNNAESEMGAIDAMNRISADRGCDWRWVEAFLAYNLPIIAGPCGLESESDAQATTSQGLEEGIIAFRACNDKPRTKPGHFEGMKEKAIPWMVKMAREKFIVCFEALDLSLARQTLKSIFETVPSAKVIIWTGARSPGAHARDVARVVTELGCSQNVAIMIKNPMFKCITAWEGAVQYAIDGGADQRQLLLCHRGFFPAVSEASPLRNPPDFELALKLMQKTKLKLVFDPSHAAGSVLLADELFMMAACIPEVSAQMIEVRPGHRPAQSDNGQQLSWERFGALLRRTYLSRRKRESELVDNRQADQPKRNDLPAEPELGAAVVEKSLQNMRINPRMAFNGFY